MGNRPDRSRVRAWIAVGLIALGAAFWLGIGTLWPMFVVVPGLIFLGLAAGGGRSGAPFAIPGMIITGTGVMLLIQNLTGYWSSWAYAWTLYGVFLGLGLAMMGRLLDDPAFESLGRVFVLVGGAAFVVLGVLMELARLGGLGGAWWPLLLIGLGLLLLARPFTLRRALKSGSKRDEHLFTGPVVYSSRKRDASRLAASDSQEHKSKRG